MHWSVPNNMVNPGSVLASPLDMNRDYCVDQSTALASYARLRNDEVTLQSVERKTMPRQTLPSVNAWIKTPFHNVREDPQAGQHKDLPAASQLLALRQMNNTPFQPLNIVHKRLEQRRSIMTHQHRCRTALACTNCRARKVRILFSGVTPVINLS